MTEQRWEFVCEERDDSLARVAVTHKMKVEGGYLYRVAAKGGVTLAFVPSPKNTYPQDWDI